MFMGLLLDPHNLRICGPRGRGGREGERLGRKKAGKEGGEGETHEM